MCGFCGFTGALTCTDEEINKHFVIEQMMEKIKHRGPDGEGTFFDEQDRFQAGFRRLSFIDLVGGSQPIFNENRSIVVFQNGEIYNYKELRTSLETLGHSFYTESDTETLVHLYEEYGEKMLNHLRGMFAFVLFDQNTGELFGARDFFGIKPFYYSMQGNNLLFASEIKSMLSFPDFKKEVNEQALMHYLTFQYSVLPETFFKGVFKLMPGHMMRFKDGELKIEKYWNTSFEPDEERSLSDTVDEIDQTIMASIEAHKISDVEVGSFLSSGVDSSYIASCFKGDKTFTVGFDYEKYNEIDYAKNLSENVGVKNINKMITTDEYWDVLPKVQYHMDEPLADPSAVALYFVSKLASGHVKAALSGEGADEFFGGYNIYKEPIDLKILTDLPMPIRKTLGFLANLIPFHIKGKSFFIRGSKTLEERFIGNANIFSVKERERLLKNYGENLPPSEITKPHYAQTAGYDDITKMQYLDIHLWMVGDILLKADKMSMAHSIEVRVPFLDKEVFKTARTISTKYRVNKTATKYAFRRASERHLPESVANKRKLGFPVPIRIWLREPRYYDKVKKMFASGAAERFFNTEELLYILDRHKLKKEDLSRKIWTIYMFLVWYECYFL